MSNIARKKGREGSAGPKYVKMCQKFPYFWCQKRDPQNAFFLLSTGTIIATNTVEVLRKESQSTPDPINDVWFLARLLFMECDQHSKMKSKMVLRVI